MTSMVLLSRGGGAPPQARSTAARSVGGPPPSRGLFVAPRRERCPLSSHHGPGGQPRKASTFSTGSFWGAFSGASRGFFVHLMPWVAARLSHHSSTPASLAKARSVSPESLLRPPQVLDEVPLAKRLRRFR